MTLLASRHLPGVAFAALPDVEIVALSTLTDVRPDVDAVIAVAEAVPLALLPRLRLVANFGVGVDRIDVAACARRGITVTNTPGVLDDANADLAFALILATRRRLVEGDQLVRAGGWPGSPSSGRLAEEVTGSTLGIIGLGRVGSAVARRAQGFRMVVRYTARKPLETALGEYRELDTLLAESDIVTVHAPLTDATRGLLDARRLSLLRDGACLVNAARGAIVDEAALTAELVSGRLRAGLDAFWNEPHVPEALIGLPDVVLTPHMGSGTRQTHEAMADLVVANVRAVRHGDPPLTPVVGA